MIIHNNLASLTAYNSLESTNKSLQKSIEKLSTGMRVNHASDDAAGFAISNKMRTQISGLDEAKSNARDGISLLQTAEGALEATNSMLQRMRELAIQASNDSLTSQDRSYIQLEIDEIKDNINRISNNTQFNNKRLLDGSSGALWSSNDLNVNVKINGGLTSIDEFGQKISSEGNYRIEVTAEPGQAQVQKSNIMGKITQSGTSYSSSSSAKVVFVIDVSGSMGGELQKVKDNIESFIKNIKAKGVDDVEIGICTYGTNNIDDPNVKAYTYSNGSLWSGNIDEIKELMNPIGAPYALDTYNYYAVQKAAEIYGPTFGNNGVSGTDVIQSRYMVVVTDVDHTDYPEAVLSPENAKTVTTRDDVMLALKGNADTLTDDIELSAICDITDSTSEFYDLTADSRGLMFQSGTSWGGEFSSKLGSKIAEQASFTDFPPSKDTKLSEIGEFITPSGTFILDTPKQLTIHQGGKATIITLDKSDTLGSLTEKINDAIANDLGQIKYAKNGKNFATYVSSDEIVDLSSQSVPGTIVIRSAIPGKAGEIHFSCDDEDLLNALGLNTIQESSESTFTASVYEAHSGIPVAKDVKATESEFKGIIPPEIDIQVDHMAGLSASWDESTRKFILAQSKVYNAMIHLKDNGIVFQTGANRGEDFLIQLGDSSTSALGIDAISVISRKTASRAISVIDRAINKISNQRAKIGAYENSLEHTIENLDTTTLNLISAESRIKDADMAQEMMNFVKYQILNQSGNSMLAQANQLPQSVLSLLGQ